MSEPIAGPDPAVLTDDELGGAAHGIAALAKDIAGGPVTSAAIAALDPDDRFVLGVLQVGFEVLKAEADRRTAAEAAVLAAEVEQFLAER